MKPSEVSAARFIAMQESKRRQSPSVRKAYVLRDARRRYREDPHWKYLDDKVPGASKAWGRDVGLRPADFVLGVTGTPPRALAIDRGCYEPGYTRCRCCSFRDGQWRSFCHPPIASTVQAQPPLSAASRGCDVCEVACSSCDGQDACRE